MNKSHKQYGPHVFERLGFHPVMSYRQIAKELGMSETNVGYTLYVAIKKIKKRLRERGVCKEDYL